MKRWAVVLVVLGLLVALTAPAAVAGIHKTGKPFVGFVGGASSWPDNEMGCPAGATTHTEVKGLATPFGRVTLSMMHCPGEPDPITGKSPTVGTFVLTARNGTIEGSYEGTADFDYFAPLGSWFAGENEMVITGGSGAFAGASGTAVLRVTLRYDGMEDPAWPFLGYWYGRIDF